MYDCGLGCRFFLCTSKSHSICSWVVPLPVSNFRQILAVFVDVLLVVNQFVRELLFQ